MSYVKTTMSAQVAARVAAAFAKNYNYQATITNEEGEMVANPETLQQFIFRQREKFIKDNIKAAEVPDLARADRAAKIAEIDALEIIFEYIEE